MIHFLRKYSPNYAKNNLEGWSIILVVAVGFEATSFAHNWLEMIGFFIAGVLCAHIIACIVKFLYLKISSNYEKDKSIFGLWCTRFLYGFSRTGSLYIFYPERDFRRYQLLCTAP